MTFVSPAALRGLHKGVRLHDVFTENEPAVNGSRIGLTNTLCLSACQYYRILNYRKPNRATFLSGIYDTAFFKIRSL